MNYFLLANNRDIKQSTVDKLPLNEKTDTLVLFNFLMPLKFDKVRDYPNKICISRKRPIQSRLESSYIKGMKEYYVNLGVIRKLQNLFTEIYVLPCPHNMAKSQKDFEDHLALYNFDATKIKCIDYNINYLNKKLNYDRRGIQSEVSTGIVVYEYLKNIKSTEDKIILVSFDSGVSKFHDKDWETQYFTNEISNNFCYAIDSYGTTSHRYSAQ